MNQDLSLDDLYREAKAAMRAQAAAEVKQPAKPRAGKQVPEAAPDTSGIYRDPANWVRGKVITLIHSETQSLLGYFVEWKHKTVPDARRLVREELATIPQHSPIEYVSGDWSPKAVVEDKPRLPWHVTLPATLDVLLLDFSLESNEVLLDCSFGEGTLDRVELVIPTTFASLGQFLSLPEGTNILPRLSPKTIAAIHRQLDKS